MSVFPDKLAAARRALAEGNEGMGRQLLDEAVAGRPDDPHLRVEVAALLWDLYDFAAAAEHHQHLKCIALADPLPLMQAAKANFWIGRFAAAVDLLEAARAVKPDCPDILAMLGSALERSGQLEEAREVTGEALQRDPAHPMAARLLAHLDFTGGDLQAAHDRLRRHLQQYPGAEDWRLRQELAGVLDRLGEPEAAMEELAMAKQMLAPAAQSWLAQSHRLRQRQWEMTRRISPDDWQRWQSETTDNSDQESDVVLMAGFARSGTTLLERMFASHPACVGTDESGVLFSQFIRPIVHGARTTEEAFREIDGFDRGALEAGRGCYFHCTEAFLGERLAGRMIIDKEPLQTADLPLPLRLFPKARLLMPLRDPRDVVISFYFTMVPMAANSAAAVSLEECCRFYADTMRHWLYLRPMIPHPALATRYEDLIARPVETKRRVADFLGLRDDASLADPTSHVRRPGGRTPTYHDATQPLYTRALGRWKNYEHWLRPHLHLLEPYLDVFGYES